LEVDFLVIDVLVVDHFSSYLSYTLHIKRFCAS